MQPSPVSNPSSETALQLPRAVLHHQSWLFENSSKVRACDFDFAIWIAAIRGQFEILQLLHASHPQGHTSVLSNCYREALAVRRREALGQRLRADDGRPASNEENSRGVGAKVGAEEKGQRSPAWPFLEHPVQQTGARGDTFP